MQFEEAKHIEPADSRPHVQLSSIYVSLGQERKAREEREWALRLNSEIKGKGGVVSGRRVSPQVDFCQR